MSLSLAVSLEMKWEAKGRSKGIIMGLGSVAKEMINAINIIITITIPKNVMFKGIYLFRVNALPSLYPHPYFCAHLYEMIHHVIVLFFCQYLYNTVIHHITDYNMIIRKGIKNHFDSF